MALILEVFGLFLLNGPFKLPSDYTAPIQFTHQSSIKKNTMKTLLQQFFSFFLLLFCTEIKNGVCLCFPRTNNYLKSLEWSHI
jgi:hypothetical protein